MPSKSSRRASATRERVRNREEEQLLRRTLAGDARAWLAFHRRYDPGLRLTVLAVLQRYKGGHYADADLEDIVAEVWAVLLRDDLRRLRIYDPRRCSLSRWLELLATNCAIDQLRLGHADTVQHGSPDIVELLIDHQQPSPQRRLESLEQRALFMRAVAQLKHGDRGFVRHWLDDRDASDLAVELGISVHTVYSRKFKIRQKLLRLVAQLSRAA